MPQVVVGALVRRGEVLLVHRRPGKHAYPGVWDLPGGMVEDGESELAALARELREELGIRVAADTASHLCRVLVGGAHDPVLLSAWLVRDWDGTPSNVAPDEHDDLGWFALTTMPPLPHDLVTQTLLRAALSPPAPGAAG